MSFHHSTLHFVATIYVIAALIKLNILFFNLLSCVNSFLKEYVSFSGENLYGHIKLDI